MIINHQILQTLVTSQKNMLSDDNLRKICDDYMVAQGTPSGEQATLIATLKGLRLASTIIGIEHALRALEKFSQTCGSDICALYDAVEPHTKKPTIGYTHDFDDPDLAASLVVMHRSLLLEKSDDYYEISCTGSSIHNKSCEKVGEHRWVCLKDATQGDQNRGIVAEEVLEAVVRLTGRIMCHSNNLVEDTAVVEDTVVEDTVVEWQDCIRLDNWPLELKLVSAQ
jgi:hypothetical protein